MKHKVSVIFFVIFLIYSHGAYADAEEGKIKSQTCLGCHGVPSYTNVYPSYHVPRLAGQHREYLVTALKAYDSGARWHPTMQVQARKLVEKDINDIADYFSEMESAAGNPNAIPPANLQEKVAVCSACHTNDGNSIIPTFPKIAGQREDYLYQTLLDYKSQKRKNAIMLGIITSLSDDDMRQLSRYFSRQPGLGTISISNMLEK